MAGRILDESKCLEDPKNFGCVVNKDPDLFYDILDFMRYFDRSPADLKKEGKLKQSAAKGIPGFKYVHSDAETDVMWLML